MLFADDESEELPVHVCETHHVKDVVLSVFIRRGRAPEPGEVLFCTADTTEEEIELLLWRCFFARSNGRMDYIFVLADVQLLSYHLQCTAVDMLREMRNEYGVTTAATLFFVGDSSQHLMSALSDKSIEYVPLPPADIAKGVHDMALRHQDVLSTTVVRSSSHGTGKTQFIMRQTEELELEYYRVPFRQATTVSSLVSFLNGARGPQIKPFHFDIGAL